MQAMRDLLRTTLAKSLDGLQPLDRLAASWPVAAGHGIAERSSVTSLDGGVATITVADTAWQNQLRSIAGQLTGDLARISHVPLTDILFVLPGTQSSEARQARSAPAKTSTRKPQ